MSKIVDPYWFAGEILAPGNLQLHPIYIQHLPKTGTTTLFVSLSSAFDAQFKMIAERSPGFNAPRSVRLDNPEDLQHKHIPEQFALLASHHPYGFHTHFAKPFTKLITVLREPYQRVSSSYTYECMRSATPPSTEGFQAFYRSESNQNVMAKLLAGCATDMASEKNHVDMAIEHLHNNFLLYGTTKHISRIASLILRLNKLPNVLCDHLNKTEAGYLIDGLAFKDEILDLNQFDSSVFDFVEHDPRIDIPGIDVEHPATPHQRTVLIQEISNDSQGALQKKKVISTEQIVSSIANDRCDKEKFDALF